MFRSLKPEGKEKKLLVEIWDLLAAVKEEELELQKEHGDWYFDGAFSPQASGAHKACGADI